VEDPFFDDPFLDDLDLFYEGLLSEEDARRMYRRGEITKAQLEAYLVHQQRRKGAATKPGSNMWVIALVIILLAAVCVCGLLSGIS